MTKQIFNWVITVMTSIGFGGSVTAFMLVDCGVCSRPEHFYHLYWLIPLNALGMWASFMKVIEK